MSEQESEIVYASYNGLSRRPMVFGVPYMATLGIASVSLLITVALAIKFGPLAFLFLLLVIPVFLFIRMICATDDRAIDILILEIKWAVIKVAIGSSKYFGGTLTFFPTSYGRNSNNVKRYFEEAAKQ